MLTDAGQGMGRYSVSLQMSAIVKDNLFKRRLGALILFLLAILSLSRLSVKVESNRLYLSLLNHVGAGIIRSSKEVIGEGAERRWSSAPTEYIEPLCHPDMPTEFSRTCYHYLASVVLAGNELDPVVTFLQSSPSHTTQHMLLAWMAGDAAYNQENKDLAIRLWSRYLPPVALIHKLEYLLQNEDRHTAALLSQRMDGFVPMGEFHRAKLGTVLASLAIVSAREGDFASAENYWDWAIRVRPEYATFQYGQCGTLIASSRWQEALRYCRTAVELDPSEIRYYVRLARVLLVLDEEVEARGVLMEAIRQDPNNDEVQSFLDRLPSQ